jgi:elongation factor G
MVVTLTPVGADAAERLRAALNEIAVEEPDVRIHAETEGIYRLSGKNKTQIESICNRLCDRYQCSIEVSPIKAAILETIRKEAKAEGKYIRQTGGHGNYGHCKIHIEPNEPGKGYEFVNSSRSIAIPNIYIKPAEEGIQEAMQRGIVAGYPMVDVKVTLIGGSCHETDSNEMAFRFAGSLAFNEAARKASPVVLEPHMVVDIDVPEELREPIIREIDLHRGRIESVSSIDGFSEIKAVVPLVELLNSNSLGFYELPMEFVGYVEVSGDNPSGDAGSGVTANRPNHPRPRGLFDLAIPEGEDE